jgi:O-antigen ligase
LTPSFQSTALSGARAPASGVLRVLETTIFYGLLLVLFLTAIPYGTVESWAIAAFECCIFFLALLWVAHATISDTWFGASARLFYPLAAMIGLAVLQSFSWSQTEASGIMVNNSISADAFESWSFALRLGALTVAGMLAVRFTTNIFRLSFLLHTIILVTVLSAIFGIIRQTVQHDQGFILPYLRWGGGFAQFINKNHMSFLIEPAIGLLLGITLLRRDRHERLLLYSSAIILLWVALVMSRSRGGLLALTVETVFAAALFIYFRKHRRESSEQPKGWTRSVLLLAITSIVLVLVIGFGVVWLGGDQLSTGVETATQELATPNDLHEGANRIDIWRATWRMARAHPFAGVGLGGYWAAVPRYHDASGVLTPQQAHNDYLELVASAGILGAALFVWFVVELIRRVRYSLKSFRGFQRAATLGALLGILGVGVHSLVDFGLHITINAVVFVMLLAILSLNKLDQRPAAQAHRNAAFN